MQNNAHCNSCSFRNIPLFESSLKTINSIPLIPLEYLLPRLSTAWRGNGSASKLILRGSVNLSLSLHAFCPGAAQSPLDFPAHRELLELLQVFMLKQACGGSCIFYFKDSHMHTAVCMEGDKMSFPKGYTWLRGSFLAGFKVFPLPPQTESNHHYII